MLDNFIDLGNSAWREIALAAIAFWVAIYVVNTISKERRISALGGHGSVCKSWIPFGLTYTYQGVRAGMENENLRFWHSLFRKYGHPSNPFTVETSVLGIRLVFTADPENIKAILATQFNDYGKGEHFHRDFKDFLGDGIFATDGKLWHDSRQLIRPQFVKDRVSDLACFERHIVALLPLLSGNGQATDVKDLFFRFTLDAATEFLLGRSVDSLHNPQTGFAEAFAEVQATQSVIARAGPLNWFVPRRAFYRNLRILNDFLDPYIDEALSQTAGDLEKTANSQENYTFLHAIASHSRDRKVLRDQLLNILLAGRDTTACTLSWLFYELGRNPKIVFELQREIQETIGSQPPTYADLKAMKYLTYTINETLRMYPVVPFNIRMALKDTTLPRGGGADGSEPMGILKDTPIGYSTHYMQLTDEIYPPVSDSFPPPELFRPDRWRTWSPRPWTHIPFNGGPRICVGQQFAMTEMAYTIVRILQRFSQVNGVKGPDVIWPKASDWVRGLNGEITLPEKVARREPGSMVMKSEIVLQPADKVLITFEE